MLTDDARTTDALLYYKRTYEPKDSGELKTDQVVNQFHLRSTKYVVTVSRCSHFT